MRVMIMMMMMMIIIGWSVVRCTWSQQGLSQMGRIPFRWMMTLLGQRTSSGGGSFTFVPVIVVIVVVAAAGVPHLVSRVPLKIEV